MEKAIVVALFALLLVSCSSGVEDPNDFRNCQPGVSERCLQEGDESLLPLQILGSSGVVEVPYELADTALERTTGLMYRNSLAKDTGMLFEFKDNVSTKFWMKNVKFDLDMLFVTEEGTIIYIEHKAPPCKREPCPTYGPPQLFRYVLEVNGGFVRKHNIKEGDTISRIMVYD